MVLELFDLLVHAAIPEHLLELGKGNELDQRAGEVNHCGTAEHNQGNCDGAEADGENRYDRHKEQIAETPPVEHVANDGQSPDDHNKDGAVN